MILSSLGLAEKSRSVLLAPLFPPSPVLNLSVGQTFRITGGVTPAVPSIHSFKSEYLVVGSPPWSLEARLLSSWSWRQLCLPTLGRSFDDN